MKEIPQAEIDGLIKFFENKKYPIEEVVIAGKKFQYYVVPQSLNSDLPDFAQRATRTIPETKEVVGVFSVSDSLPVSLRPFWAMHEIIEFTQIGIDKQGRCRQAETEVIANIDSKVKSEYISRRITFFENLISYFKKHDKEFTQEDIREAELTLEFLRNSATLFITDIT